MSLGAGGARRALPRRTTIWPAAGAGCQWHSKIKLELRRGGPPAALALPRMMPGPAEARPHLALSPLTRRLTDYQGKYIFLGSHRHCQCLQLEPDRAATAPTACLSEELLVNGSQAAPGRGGRGRVTVTSLSPRACRAAAADSEPVTELRSLRWVP